MIDEKTRDAERQVVGSCMTSRDALDDVLAVISTGDLWDPRHALVLEACEAVARTGAPLETLTVAEQLGDSLGRAGGLSYLHELVGTVVAPSSAGYLAETLVRPASLMRAVATVGHRLVGMTSSDEGQTRPAGPGFQDPLDIVNAARLELDAIATGRAAPMSHEQDVYAALDALEDEEQAGVPTPWRDLNEATGGWRPGELIVIGARPAVGKSVIAQCIALDMARRHRHAHFASLEMSKVELYHRLLGAVGEVDGKRISHRKLEPADWEKLARAAKHLSELPISVDPSPHQRVADIHARARAIKRTGKLGVVVVDYLQLMKSGKRAESRQQEVSEFSRSLKLMAKELEVPVVALSQLNRGLEHRADRMPGLADLRESGSIEQDSDVVILLHRDPDKSPDLMSMLLAKNRHGPSDQLIRLSWEGHYSRATDFMPQAAPSHYERNLA